MPSIKDAINTDLSGYLPAKPPVLSIVPANSYPAVNLRCPLPPFNADPDSLRQFENQTTGPRNRVWPLPQQSGGASTTTTVTNVVSTSGSSSSSSTTVKLKATTVTLTTGLLIAGVNFQGFVNMSPSFQLLSLGVTGPCEVRMYGTMAAQFADVFRLTGAPVPAEVTPNIISCVSFDTAPYVWGWQNRCGANQANPQTSAIYVSVFNTIPAVETPVTVTIQYLPLES